MTNCYVYYRIDPAHEAGARAALAEIIAAVEARVGIRGSTFAKVNEPFQIWLLAISRVLPVELSSVVLPLMVKVLAPSALVEPRFSLPAFRITPPAPVLFPSDATGDRSWRRPGVPAPRPARPGRA